MWKNQYCIAKTLLKEYMTYVNYQSQQIIYKDLPFLIFFCEIMHIPEHCNHLANLCVISNYNLDKNSPCTIFFATQQSSMILNGAANIIINNRQNNYQMMPFLFYKKGKDMVDELNKLIDYSYSLENDKTEATNRKNSIELILVSYNLNGIFKTIRPSTLYDLNFCDESSAQYTKIKFGQSFRTQCRINVKRLISYAETKLMFIDLYLNYTENNVGLMKNVPILIRQAFAHNAGDVREKWQLVKRFCLVDIFTAPNETYRSKMFIDSDNIQKFRKIRHVESVELLFNVIDDQSFYGNKISTPILIVNYAEVETKQSESDLHVNFDFQVTFKMNFKFGTGLDVSLIYLYFLNLIIN